MENGMNKIQLRFDQHTKADEVLDQIVRTRLQQIHDGISEWGFLGDDEVMTACKTLLDWMGNPHAQEASD
jgi:hypothetical protein